MPFGHGRVALRADCPLPEAPLHARGHEEERLQQRCTDPHRRGSDICCAASGSSFHPEPGSLPHVDWGHFTSEIKVCHRARLSYAAQPPSNGRQLGAITLLGHLPSAYSVPLTARNIQRYPVSAAQGSTQKN